MVEPSQRCARMGGGALSQLRVGRVRPDRGRCHSPARRSAPPSAPTSGGRSRVASATTSHSCSVPGCRLSRCFSRRVRFAVGGNAAGEADGACSKIGSSLQRCDEVRLVRHPTQSWHACSNILKPMNWPQSSTPRPSRRGGPTTTSRTGTRSRAFTSSKPRRDRSPRNVLDPRTKDQRRLPSWQAGRTLKV